MFSNSSSKSAQLFAHLYFPETAKPAIPKSTIFKEKNREEKPNSVISEKNEPTNAL